MWQPRRLVGALFALVSAILLLVSPFYPLFIGRLISSTANFTMTFDGWGFETDAPARVGAIVVNAYGLIFAAVMLFVATILTFVGARIAATQGNRRVAATSMAIAAAFTLGVAVTVLPQLTNWMDTFRATGLPGARVDTTVGLGFWMMAAGTFLALAATAIAGLPTRYREPETPPSGIAVPVQPPADES
ncbi:hypothetical protein LWC34_23400 [Kibdelosporangium philippinense]|uniref:Uncharacterized protein n=1 Tax=Kibdelosporangium philippinense TaxID=211113 RepID=A0ABS8ZD93_9PSEU|nr:hypothetical protein [Kibdelosporangium philippinense]MCE7005750.1 hypothetical protein [Kibdelosporangium philippinense]